MNDDVEGKTPPLPPAAQQRAPPSPAEGGGAELRITPNKNRVLQVQRTGGRKLFGKERKEVFLEWLAATCNVRLSAGEAGVSDKTVYKHLAKDPAFLDGFGRAVQLGYVRLEARQIQEAHRFGLGPAAAAEPAHPAPADADARVDPLLQRGEGPGEEYEVRCDLDPELVEEHFDPELALQLLREHRRHLPGSAEKRPQQRSTAQSATNREIADALAKRLKSFALRVQREEPPMLPGTATTDWAGSLPDARSAIGFSANDPPYPAGEES